MLPDAHLHISICDPDGYLERKRFHERARVEVGVQLFLLAERVYILDEIAALIQERYGNQRDVQVGGGFDMITRQNAKAAAVGRDVFIESDFHAEVCYFHSADLAPMVLVLLVQTGFISHRRWFLKKTWCKLD